MFGWGVKTVTVDELASALGQGKPVLIDVREPYEFAAGHVKGAVNVPLGQLADTLGRFDPEAETYVICQSGHRSARGARLLTRAGFEHAYSVKRGTSAWRGRLVR
jgi:rhodanese-related sulfurtransferase